MPITLYPTIVERVESTPGNLPWQAVGAVGFADCLIPGDDTKYLRLNGDYQTAQPGLTEMLVLSNWAVAGSMKNIRQVLDSAPSALQVTINFKARVTNQDPGDVTSLLARHMQGFGESPLSLNYDVTRGTSSNANIRNRVAVSSWSGSFTTVAFVGSTSALTTGLSNMANLNATVLRSNAWKLGIPMNLVIVASTIFDLSEVTVVLSETNRSAFKVQF